MHTLTRDDIARLLPHDGDMVLLDAVVGYDDDTLHAVAHNHLAATNPLRVAGRLPAWCGIEYAAQAMAVHQGLGAAQRGATPARGFLAVARDVALTRADLDELPGPLDIRVEKVVAEPTRSLYALDVSSQGQTILTGRVAVVLQEARV